jgi:hypothetical protein
MNERDLAEVVLRINEFLSEVVSGVKPISDWFRLPSGGFIKGDDGTAGNLRPVSRNRDGGCVDVILPFIRELHDVTVGLRIHQLHHVFSGLEDGTGDLNRLRKTHRRLFVPGIGVKHRY